jgi:hypothetical protein
MTTISHEELLALTGSLPDQDHPIDLATPTAVSTSCQGKMERHGDTLTIWTRLDSEPNLDTLRLVLAKHENGWDIQEQIHNGLHVEPDVSLAKLALEQNLACALPQSPSPRRRSP